MIKTNFVNLVWVEKVYNISVDYGQNTYQFSYKVCSDENENHLQLEESIGDIKYNNLSDTKQDEISDFVINAVLNYK